MEWIWGVFCLLRFGFVFDCLSDLLAMPCVVLSAE